MIKLSDRVMYNDLIGSFWHTWIQNQPTIKQYETMYVSQ